ncbi:FAM151B [Branchiostoma lanceolatum]|uniref:FAM151B protein n=1 Tax=Branchiostoma lanceolatum TaxID=7740 RepID=A0A8K0EGW6_BRALA|nr:FAM151B [Branchiostoma lanceolatum]
MEVEQGKRKRHQKKVTRYVTIAAVVGVVLVAAIALLVYFLVPSVTIDEFPTDGSLLDYFKFDRQDAMQVTWSHGANSKAQLAEALASDVHMLEADILLRGQGTPAQSDIPVMAHPPQTDSDNTFEEWLDAALESSKGLKLDFKSIGAVAPSLRVLRSSRVNRPVWLNADILPGPNTVNPGVDARDFLDTVNRIFPECTLSLGWTTGFYYDRENEGYTRGMVEEMHSYCKDLSQPVTFPIRNSLLGLPGTMENLKWLLSQSERYTITVWTSVFDVHRIYDLVRCRNAFSHKRVYYDLPKQLEDDFLQAMQRHESKVNPLSFFPLERRDALLLTWSHETNSREKLTEALQRKSNIIEADVVLGDQNQPIMAKLTDTDYDVTFEEWLSTIMAADHDVGMKLTFHTTEAVIPTMTILRQNMSKIDFPVIINADVLAPSYDSGQPLDPDLVFKPTYELYPNGVTTSVQFKGITLEGGITREMARNTHALAQRLSSPVTFTIPAAVAMTSWLNVEWLLEQSDTYTLTLTEGQISIDPIDLFTIRNDFDWGRILYDITTEKATQLARMTETGGSLVNFFQASYKIYGRDALSVTWAHGVNSREAVEDAMGAYREITMLEADVDIRSDNVPVMSDDASVAGSDVMTLEEWLDIAKLRKQGIMLEFHSVNSVVPALEIFQRRHGDLRSPVMLKAKIPGLFSKETFIDPIVDMFPHVSIVFAMRPSSPSEGYSRAQVEEISRMCANLTQVVTFSVDARHVRRSWDNLSWLLGQSPLYHLYIWAGWPEPETYSVDVTDLVFVRNNFDRSRVFYDLIPRVMEEFNMALEET